VNNVLSEEKKQQVIVLGRLGWSLRGIQKATRIRRETAAGYLKAAGIPIRAPGGWGRKPATAAKPAIQVATHTSAEKPPDLPTPEAERPPGRCPSSSACESYRDLIELGLSRGRNAMAIWQAWWTTTASRGDTTASSGLFVSCAESPLQKLAW